MSKFDRGFVQTFGRSYNLGAALHEKGKARKEKIKADTDKYTAQEKTKRDKFDAEQKEKKDKAAALKATQEKDRGIIRKLIEDPFAGDAQQTISGLSDPGVRRYSAIQRAQAQKKVAKIPKVTITGTEEVVNEEGYIDKITKFSDGKIRTDKTLKKLKAGGEKGKSLLDPNRDLTKEFGKYRKYGGELDKIKIGAEATERAIIQTPREKSKYYRQGGAWGFTDNDGSFTPEVPAQLSEIYEKYKQASSFYQQEIESNLFTDDLHAITRGMKDKETSKRKAMQVYEKYESGEVDLTENEIVALSLWYKFKFGEYLNWQEMTNNQK